MFFSEAWAASPVTGAGASFMSFIPLVLIFVVFYFFIIRPHQKKLKEHNIMLGLVKCGDLVVTNGGIIGEVKKIQETDLMIEIAPRIEVKVFKSAVSDILNKNTNESQPQLRNESLEKGNKKNKPAEKKKNKENHTLS